MLTLIGGLRKLSVGLMLCVAILSILGCQTTRIGATSPSDINRICSVWKYVSYSSKDTPTTVLEIRALNAAKDGFCQESKP